MTTEDMCPQCDQWDTLANIVLIGLMCTDCGWVPETRIIEEEEDE